MVPISLTILFEYPLPNKRGKYNLSEKELRKLLQAAYDNGYKHGFENARVQYDPKYIVTTTATGEWVEGGIKFNE